MTDLRRHDLTDETWLRLKPHPPGSKGNRGRRGKDNHLFLNAILWRLRMGTPWWDLPPQYGHWKSASNRFHRWRDNGTWRKLLEMFADAPDLEWLMIDASHIKAHPRDAGAKSRTPFSDSSNGAPSRRDTPRQPPRSSRNVGSPP